MRATIISMVMGLPGSLSGMSVAGGLQATRARGAVSGLGARCVSGQDCARPGLRRGLGLGRAQHTDASFSALGDTRFACVTVAHFRRSRWRRAESQRKVVEIWPRDRVTCAWPTRRWEPWASETTSIVVIGRAFW